MVSGVRFLRSLPRVLSVVAGEALLASLFLPWYTVLEGGSPGFSVQQQFFLTGVETWVTGWSVATPSPLSYAAAYMPGTGDLYLIVWLLTIVACALAFLNAIFPVVGSRRGPMRRRLLIAVLAIAMVAAPPLLLATVQPATVCGDSTHFPPPLGGPGPANPGQASSASTTPSCPYEIDVGGGSWSGGWRTGPQTAFFGPGSPNSDNLQWGPAAGWWLAVFSAVVFTGVAVSGALGPPESWGPPMPSRTGPRRDIQGSEDI